MASSTSADARRERALAWWVPSTALPADEPPQARWLANHAVSPMRALGGRLVATPKRLRFTPNRVDRALGGEVWEVPLAAIAAIEIAPVSLKAFFGGGLRRRLRLVTSDGAPHLFVVNDVAKVQADLRALTLGA